METIVAVGDCNTLGARELEYKGYPEKVATALGFQVINRGHTMATTREGLHILREEVSKADYVFVQFGLVDSYKTFKYSPYVLYYPDNPVRKLLRALTKKYKKVCRNKGLNRKMGEMNVVPIQEYEANIRKMVDLADGCRVILIDTVPNREVERNGEIQRYNKLLTDIAADYSCCSKVDLYQHFINNLDRYYLDNTHCNESGYTLMADKILEKLSVNLS